MIKANDLRIGNWVDIDLRHSVNCCEVVEQINLEGIIVSKDVFVPFEILKPVRITPEILEKCGFEKEGNSNVYKKIIAYADSDYPASLQFTNNNTAMQICRDGIGSICAPCEYLHQLQNLIFHLTNTELSINF